MKCCAWFQCSGFPAGSLNSRISLIKNRRPPSKIWPVERTAALWHGLISTLLRSTQDSPVSDFFYQKWDRQKASKHFETRRLDQSFNIADYNTGFKKYALRRKENRLTAQSPIAQKVAEEVVFMSRSCFESDGFIVYSNEWDWREKNFSIGRVRVNFNNNISWYDYFELISAGHSLLIRLL